MANGIRTIEVKPTPDSMIKPGELVDVVEVSPLTDRKIYNLLIDNAKQDLAKPVEHAIKKEKLRQSRRGDERIDDSILRLMGAIAHIKTERNGEPATIRVQLLGRNIEHDRNDGNFYYTFDPVLREVFLNSNVFARLKMNVMLSRRENTSPRPSCLRVLGATRVTRCFCRRGALVRSVTR
jgi:hypothetical protein